MQAPCIDVEQSGVYAKKGNDAVKGTPEERAIDLALYIEVFGVSKSMVHSRFDAVIMANALHIIPTPPPRWMKSSGCCARVAL